VNVLKAMKAAFPGTTLEQTADARIDEIEAKLSPGTNAAPAASPDAASEDPGRVRY